MDYTVQPLEDSSKSFKFALHHLSEAIGELSSALTFASMGDLDGSQDPGIREHIVHAYQHLNWYWNCSKEGQLDLTTVPEDEYRRLSGFPLELSDEL